MGATKGDVRPSLEIQGCSDSSGEGRCCFLELGHPSLNSKFNHWSDGWIEY